MFNLLIALFINPIADTCPLGKGETHLTIARVMRNFGRFTVEADSNALKGMNPHDKVTIEHIRKSIDELGIAISCAQAVLESPKDDLLPSCTKALTGQAYGDYVSTYLRLMKDFEVALAVYQDLFKQVLAQPENERNFEVIYKQSKSIEELVDAAHKELFGH